MKKTLILETHTVHDVLPLIDQDTWLLLDLDNTLFQASQALGHVDWLWAEISKLIAQGMSQQDAFHSMYPLWKKTQMLTDVIPVEKALIDTVKDLQKKGVIVMGVTHREPFLASETLRQAHSLDINFLRSTPSDETFEFFETERALYWNGILFVDSFNDKGKIFRSLLKHLHATPKKVVFLDDKKKNVEEFAEAMAAESIDYAGVYYTAITKGPKIYSEEMAKVQLNSLQKIMSNELAALLLQNDADISKSNMEKQPIPEFLYKSIPASEWRKSLHKNVLCSPHLHDISIKLLKQEQLHSNELSDEKHVLLKLLSNQLIGRLTPKTDSENAESHFYLHEGSIPLDAIVEVRH